MPTLNLQVAAGTDDARESQDGQDWSVSSTSIQMDAADAEEAQYNGGFVFHNVTIPAGSTINSATLSLNITNAAVDDVDATVGFEDVDDADDFSTTANVTTRRANLTTASVAWSATGLGTGWKSPADLSAPLQEIINRPGWASGNSVCCIVAGNVGVAELTCWAYEGNASLAAKLDIDYTEGGGTPGGMQRTMYTTMARSMVVGITNSGD